MTKYFVNDIRSRGKIIALVASEKSNTYDDQFDIKILKKFYSDGFYDSWKVGSIGSAFEEEFKKPKEIIRFVFEEVLYG